AGPHRHYQTRLGRGVIGLAQSEFHVACHRAGHEQHVSMARRSNEVDAETFEIIDWAVQTDDFNFATIARTGVHFADMEGSAQQALRTVLELLGEILERGRRSLWSRW